MCEYFVKADPIQYEQRSRTVRTKSVLTSLRLENMVWDILAEMAEEEGCTTNALISKFHDEVMAHRGEVPNFASFLRVTSMRYLRRSLMAMEKRVEAIEEGRGNIKTFTPSLRFAEPDTDPKPLIRMGR